MIGNLGREEIIIRRMAMLLDQEETSRCK